MALSCAVYAWLTLMRSRRALLFFVFWMRYSSSFMNAALLFSISLLRSLIFLPASDEL